jgi:D-alanine-D-alanine ligase
VTDVPEAEALSQRLEYPLMVKHPNSFGSTGMTKKSRVKTKRSLASQVRRVCERFGSARVEEFIDGREFTVLVVDDPSDLGEPFVYPPVELIFPEGESFLHSHVKWQKWVYLKPVPEKALARQLMDMSCRMYRALGGAGYARTDIRMRADGEPVMIEINPNPGILFKPEHLGPADVAMEYDREGHAGFFRRIFESAILRQEARTVRYSLSEVITHANLYSV